MRKIQFKREAEESALNAIERKKKNTHTQRFINYINCVKTELYGHGHDSFLTLPLQQIEILIAIH